MRYSLPILERKDSSAGHVDSSAGQGIAAAVTKKAGKRRWSKTCRRVEDVREGMGSLAVLEDYHSDVGVGRHNGK
jgi:hypothetical protein